MDVTDELIREALEQRELIEQMAQLLGVKLEGGRYVDRKGSPRGNNLAFVVKQIVAEDWASFRIRSDVWASDLPEGRKQSLVALFNVTERLLHIETHKGDPIEAYNCGELIKAHLEQLFGG